MADVEQRIASSACDNEPNSGNNKLEKVTENDSSKSSYKRKGARFSSSSSAQDLRHLELEKEKDDPSSPRGVLEACMRCSDHDKHSPEENSSEEVCCKSSKALSHWSRFFKIWKRRSVKRLASFPPIRVPKVSVRKSRSTRENPDLRNIYNFKSSLVNFSLSDLKNATNNFSEENLIGRGGYSEVYKGTLQNGQHIAVKRLMKGTSDERTATFLSELGTIAHVDHPNTAKLIGCGVEGEMHLVFELSRVGSLGSLLHGSDSNELLDWSKRYKIALGIADGLLYLHESCQRRIIHRDIKADNILLTENFEPQICDFGLAKWLPKQLTHHNVSKFEGTFGYFAPEYFMHGIVDEKTDVYSYGVLLLELVSGRKALDDSKQSVVIWAKPLLDSNNIEELVDASLGNNYDPEEIDRVALTASLCIEQSPILRPQMSQVAILLRGDDYILQCAKKCQNQRLQRTYSEELLDAQEYNSTKYLNDLHMHREIALGA